MGGYCSSTETEASEPLVEKSVEEKELDRLEDVADKLEIFIKGLEQDANDYRDQAKKHVKEGHIHLALSKLAIRRQIIQHAAKHSKSLTNIHALKLQVGSSVATREVVRAMKIGSATLERVNKSVGDVQDLMARIQAAMDDAASNMAALAENAPLLEAANGGVPFDEEELEKELAELQKETQTSWTGSRHTSQVSTPAPMAILKPAPTLTVPEPVTLDTSQTPSSPRRGPIKLLA